MTEVGRGPKADCTGEIPGVFTVTKAAAKQIRRSAASSDTEELALRIAASRTGDGGIDYRMGFDDVGVDDTLLSTNGVDVVIASADKDVAQRYGARLCRDRIGRSPLHLPQPERFPTTARPPNEHPVRRGSPVS